MVLITAHGHPQEEGTYKKKCLFHLNLPLLVGLNGWSWGQANLEQAFTGEVGPHRALVLGKGWVACPSTSLALLDCPFQQPLAGCQNRDSLVRFLGLRVFGRGLESRRC